MINGQRTNRAKRVAYWPDVQRIFKALTLNAFIHSWTAIIKTLLTPAALTVLQFLAALHRASQNGYIGCAVSYELLAPRIAQATERKCSVRTLQRGIKRLQELGLVDLSWWAIPTETIRNGEHEHKIPGTRAIQTKYGWKRLQIRVVTLTEKALALWDPTTCSKGSYYIPQFAQFLTHDKMAPSLNNDLIDKSIKLKSQTFDDHNVQTRRKMLSDNVPGLLIKSEEQPRANLEGQTTSPNGLFDNLMTDRSAVEHLASTDSPPDSPLLTDTPNDTQGESNEETSISDNVRNNSDYDIDPNSTQTDNLSGINHAPPPADIKTNTKIPPKKTEKPKGVRHARPKIPRNVRNKTTWAMGQIFILATLHDVLQNFSRREADSIYERARFELSRAYPSNWPTCVDWPYWIGRMGKFLPSERRYHMVKNILPLLKAGAAVIPREPRSHSVKPHKSYFTAVVNDTLDPFLRKFYDKFCSKKEI